jgi:hypothetical protein
MTQNTCTAFTGAKLVATGPVADVAVAVKKAMEKNKDSILIFDDVTGHPIEIDFRGTASDVVARLSAPPAAELRGPGRPKLGVVAREVTLLPRHWDWLKEQPGGASVALRKLIDQARTTGKGRDVLRARQDAVYRFMSAMTGNLPGFEEAIRALFARDKARFDTETKKWPADLRAYTHRIAADIF